MDALVNVTNAFTASDDVPIVKDIGSKTFYQHMTLVPWIQKQAEKPHSPLVLVLTDELTEGLLPRMRRVVLPIEAKVSACRSSKPWPAASR